MPSVIPHRARRCRPNRKSPPTARALEKTDLQLSSAADGFCHLHRPHEVDPMSADPRSLDRWRRNPVSWIETHLYDPETGKRFKLLPAEREFLRHALATGSDGRLLYPEQIFGAIKKSGKTGFAAILVITILLLYGGRYAEAYCVANDFEQLAAL
jgi:hypothetical protein